MTYYSALHYAAKAEAAATTATTLLPYLTDITTVATNIASVNTISADISSITTAATNIASINTVATNISDISAVVSNATNINTVATNISNVNTVATDISNVNSVAGDLTNIDAVNANKTNIDAVAGNETNINAVNANKTNIDAVAGDITNVNAVASDLTNINAVAADLTNIDNASTYAAEAKQYAIGDPSEPAGNSAKYWAQQAAGQVIPSQTGHNGEYLTTDGTDLSWGVVDALPDQTGQSGKYLTTDGTDASWATINVNPDGVSITTNSDDELQTIGVINQNDTTTALKVWAGDEADLPANKDTNTFYATEELGVSLLDTLYPVGSIYITTNATCPLSTLIAGSTWVLVGQDRVLQGAGLRGAVGTTLNESLPNITGDTGQKGSANYTYTSGAFYGKTGSDTGFNPTSSGTQNKMIAFDASRSSSTYQDDAPVQPDAYLVNIYRRTA